MSTDRLNSTKIGKIQAAMDRQYGAGAIVVVMGWPAPCHRFDFVYGSPHAEPDWHGHASISRRFDQVQRQDTNRCDRHESCAGLLRGAAA